MSEQNNFQVYFIVGTTAVGKSQWALKWAQEHGGTILNGDSVQVYKKVNIGTAKPSLNDFKKCPHLLYDFVEPPHQFTAGEYFDVARKTLEEKSKDPSCPCVFVVGGSGFYLKALENGMFDVPEPSEEVIQKIEEWRKNEINLYEELKKLDPTYAQKLGPTDEYRVQRGLEINLSFGKNVLDVESEFQENKDSFPYSIKKIGLFTERTLLREKVKARIQKMLDKGLTDEVEALLSEGLADWAPLKSVGYKEVVSYLKKEYTFDQMKERLEINTMQLAKRQRTWFKKQDDIVWYDVVEDLNKLRAGVL